GATRCPVDRRRPSRRAELFPDCASSSATSISRQVSSTHGTIALLHGVRRSRAQCGVPFRHGVAPQIQAWRWLPPVSFSAELCPDTRDRRFSPKREAGQFSNLI